MVFRANIPAELDVLDSPLLSSTPMGESALLGSMPGSALAEIIFNDPSAWETSEGDEFEAGAGGADDGVGAAEGFDPMAWFVDEIERFNLHSAASTATSLDSASTDSSMNQQQQLTPVELKTRSLVSSQLLKPGRESSLLDGDIKRRNIRPVSLTALFDMSGDDFVRDIQMHMGFGKGSDGLDRMPATADIFTPDTADSSSIMTLSSPAPIYSASTTLSFLDLYLESPDGVRRSIRARPKPRRTPALTIQKLDTAAMDSTVARPLSLLSPMLLHPDMSVEPLKRGSTVPPLDQLAIRTTVTGIPPPAAAAAVLDSPPAPPAAGSSLESPGPRPSLPPGLSPPPEDETSSQDAAAAASSSSLTLSSSSSTGVAAACGSLGEVPSPVVGQSVVESPSVPAARVAAAAASPEPLVLVPAPSATTITTTTTTTATNTTTTAPTTTYLAKAPSPPRRVSPPPMPRRAPAAPRARVNLARVLDAPPSTSGAAAAANSRPATPVRRLPTIPPPTSAAPTPTPLASSSSSSSPSSLSSSSSAAAASPSPSPSSGLVGSTGVVPSAASTVVSPLLTGAATSASSHSSHSLANGLLSPDSSSSSGGGQTIVYFSRAMSAVRSPLGGPVGPRSRASGSGGDKALRATPSPSLHGPTSHQVMSGSRKAAVKAGMGVGVGPRRPPGLHL